MITESELFSLSFRYLNRLTFLLESVRIEMLVRIGRFSVEILARDLYRGAELVYPFMYRVRRIQRDSEGVWINDIDYFYNEERVTVR